MSYLFIKRKYSPPAEDVLPPLPHPIYFSDDLTKRRASLAYLARQSKLARHIRDTWVYDCKILIKDFQERIYTINDEKDLRNHEQRLVNVN